MHAVVETTIFARRAAVLLSDEERSELIDALAANPMAGDLIVGTGGVRKLRFAAKGKGKSGGVRVIYYFGGGMIPIYALMIYGKNEQADLKPAERMALKRIVTAIEQEVERRKP